ncbi:TIGR03752 family integrating conjugative element protein [Pseudomonas caricapapayae]|nr:TIGR03752 family integrating conjugative element protein [Pseudomonas caricapapayae]
MSTNSASGLLKWIVIGVAAVAIFIGITTFRNKSDRSAQVAEDKPQLTPAEMKTLGVEGDTSKDIVATLVGQVKAMRTDLKTLQGSNEDLQKENRRLRSREGDIDHRIESGLRDQKDKLQEDQNNLSRATSDAKSMMERFKAEVSNYKQPNSKDMPVGLGLDGGEGSGFTGSGTSPADGITWIDPSDQREADASPGSLSSGAKKNTGYSFPTSFGSGNDSTQSKLADATTKIGGADKKKVRKAYTLPQNSTLMGSVAMTALVGRVPIDGTVNDPYPFKVLIGPDNLTANGIDLPDVAGAVVSGSATGDWTLSCVRGQVRSITFVFNDGRVRTLPAPEDASKSKGNGNSETKGSDLDQVQGGLGWISDQYGIPCIGGERKSNAKQYIGTQTLITAAGAGAATIFGNSDSSGSSTSVFSGGGGSFGGSTTTGNQAVQQILTSGVGNVSDWVNKLYGQAFAAVYVQPGAKVSIHLDKELQIDYELKGRKVKYGTGGSHVSTLD